MNITTKKNARRILTIITNCLKQTITQIISLTLSLYVIHFFSKDLWGNFSVYFLYISITMLILSWGNKEYLLREFSKTPSKIIYTFYLHLNTRLILLLISIVITFLLFSFTESIILTFWITSVFISQSLEVFWIYKRDYLKSIIIEIISFSILLSVLFLQTDLNITLLLFCYSIYQLTRAFLYFVLYFNELKNYHFIANKIVLSSSISFFLLSLFGFLQSRADFLTVTFFEKNENIAVYQVITSFFILIHSIATFLILPYVKNLYRIKNKSMELIQKKLTFISPFIVLFNLFVFYLIVTFFYNFELDIYYYILGFFITFPPYLYAIKIIRFFKENNQKYIVVTAVKAILINCFISYILLYLGYGLKGALIGSAISQVFTTYQYLKI